MEREIALRQQRLLTDVTVALSSYMGNRGENFYGAEKKAVRGTDLCGQCNSA